MYLVDLSADPPVDPPQKPDELLGLADGDLVFGEGNATPVFPRKAQEEAPEDAAQTGQAPQEGPETSQVVLDFEEHLGVFREPRE